MTDILYSYLWKSFLNRYIHTGVAVILLYINGKFTMGKLKLSLLSYNFVIKQPSLSITGCRSRYEADIVAFVVSFISSLMG